MGCPCDRARSNWRRSGGKNASLASSSSSFPSSFSRSSSSRSSSSSSSRGPRRRSRRRCLCRPPGRHRRRPAPRCHSSLGPRGVARVGPGAGWLRGDVRCGDPPRPLAVDCTKVARAEVATAARRGEDARGEPTPRVGSPKGWPRAPLLVQGKYPSPRQPAPGTAARRPRPVDENWTCH